MTVAFLWNSVVVGSQPKHVCTSALKTLSWMCLVSEACVDDVEVNAEVKADDVEVDDKLK